MRSGTRRAARYQDQGREADRRLHVNLTSFVRKPVHSIRMTERESIYHGTPSVVADTDLEVPAPENYRLLCCILVIQRNLHDHAHDENHGGDHNNRGVSVVCGGW